MIITEPMTMATDYLLAGVCLAFAWRLRSRRGARLMALAFAVTGAAAVLGGTAHGFYVPLGALSKWVWGATIACIAAGSVLLIGGGIRAAMRTRSSLRRRAEGLEWMKRAVAITVVALGVLAGQVSFHRHFNQNDLYHVVQLAGLYCLYRGTRLLSAAGRPPETAH